jgi:hypothetical protein
MTRFGVANAHQWLFFDSFAFVFLHAVRLTLPVTASLLVVPLSSRFAVFAAALPCSASLYFLSRGRTAASPRPLALALVHRAPYSSFAEPPHSRYDTVSSVDEFKHFAHRGKSFAQWKLHVGAANADKQQRRGQEEKMD